MRPGGRRFGSRTRIIVEPEGTGEDIAISVLALGGPSHNSTTAPAVVLDTTGAWVDWSMGAREGAGGFLQDVNANTLRKRQPFLVIDASCRWAIVLGRGRRRTKATSTTRVTLSPGEPSRKDPGRIPH